MYVVPPMADEPPPDFLVFVAVHLTTLQDEAARLVGDRQHADEVYPVVLSDVALHWRRLRLRRRLTGRDETGTYLRRRLAARAEQWREDQIYPVEVQLLPPAAPARYYQESPASVAYRKAALVEGTRRTQRRPQAEAAIAWEHACQQARWHRIARVTAASTLGVFAAIQLADSLPG
ncbi:hypothetical protein [Jidongwangia harbinensis]|uniref:hypothetical protein n=1 Tax=Jidongwangia harbinensis TaxID=2878561 RepID=UPI001CD94992|nr:hypothetical protein [Jidongwangia harbinensis]MCA2214718.1 hypothetical protein [Jidongwangia harbinensis]